LTEISIHWGRCGDVAIRVFDEHAELDGDRIRSRSIAVRRLRHDCADKLMVEQAPEAWDQS